METKIYSLIELKQPIGNFVLTVMPAKDVIEISKITPRHKDPKDGIQRKLIPDRVNKIANFIDSSPDRIAFPTPIILSLPDNSFDDNQFKYEITNSNDNTNRLELKLYDKNLEAIVIDGQHRLEGIKKSNSYNNGTLKLDLPVILVRDANESVCAYLFSKINGNQRPVPYSLVADLFELDPNRSITKVAHNITVDLNTSIISPFKDSIKMLGIKINPYEILSQGTIVRELEFLMTKKEDFIKIYNNNQEKYLSKIIINMFNAARNIWETDWYNDNSVIKKTVGFHGFMKALPDLYKYCDSVSDFSQSNFEQIFKISKNLMDKSNDLKISNNLYFTIDNFPSNASGAKKITDYLIRAIPY